MSDEEKKDALPTMDDFMEEDSLLGIIEEEEEKPDEEEVKDESKDDDDDDSKDDDKKDDAPKGGDDDEEVKDEDDDGSSSSDSEKDEEDADADEKRSDKSETSETFWSDVEKLTGRLIEVDYGDVDPETPEGAAIREDALVQSAIDEHLQYLSDTFPREFRALEHAARGGSIEDLYRPGEPDYSKMTIAEDNVEQQKRFMQAFYERKGFSSSRAVRMVETDEDSEEGLFKISTEALKEVAKEQSDQRERVMVNQKEQAEQREREDGQVVNMVEGVVKTGKLNKFTVPTREREDFFRYALGHIQRNPQGGYMLAQPLDSRQLEAQLQQMYFAYKKGDLSKIIQREAKTENAKRLKRSVSKGEKKTTTDDIKDRRKGSKTGLPTFEDYED